MSNPKLTVEFEARNESAVIASINRVSGVGQTYVEKWVADTRSATSRNEASYTSFWKKVLNEQDRANRTRLAEQEKTARAAAKIEEAAAKEIVRQKKIETDALIAEGKRAIDAQNSALRQKQLAMESQVSNAGGYGPKLSTTVYGPSIDLKRANDARVAEEKRVLREIEKERREYKRQVAADEREEYRKQQRMEREAKLAGGYGPTAPTQSPDRMATALNTGMVNAAAFLNVATSAYYMAGRVVGVLAGFVQDAAKWEAMDMGLRNMEGSAEGAAAATERLYQIAKAPGIDLETATKGYTQLRAMHMAGKDAERTIVDISNTVARAGGGSVAFERTMNQLKDMLATGTVYQKDLKIMKEAMPELTTLMQKAFGTTTAEGIRNLHVNANEFLQGILTQMEKLPKAQQTLTSEIENSEVAWSRLKAAFVDTDFTKRVLSDFTGMLEGMTKILNAKSINWGRLVMGILSGRGVEQGAYANGKEKDLAEVTSFFDKKEAKDVITGVKQKAGKNYRSVDSSGKTREDWIAFINKKWENAVPPAPNSEGVAAGDQKKEKKTERDPIAEDRKRLAEQLRLRQMAVEAEEAYNANMAKMLSEGVDEREAKIVADGIKSVALKRKEYEALEKDAHGDGKLLAEIERQKNEAVRAIRVKYNADRNAMADKISKEDEERELKDRIKAVQSEIDKAEERKKAILDGEKRLQEEIDKYTAGEALSAETNQLLAIENEYRLHYERIKNAKFESEAEKQRVMAAFQAKEQAAIREFYAAQYSIAVSGASDMFGALAELRKNATSESNDAYQVLFGISKAFAIADATVKLSSAAINAMTVGSSQGIPVMLANIGTVMATGGGLISQINSTAYSGVFDKGGVIGAGKWGIAGENGPEIIQGPAHVTSTRDTARLIGGSNSAPNVTVNNYAGAAVSTRTMDDGSLEVIIQRAAEAAENRIAGGIASCGGKVSQQMSRPFGVRR